MEKIFKFIDFKYFKNSAVTIGIFAVCLLLARIFNITYIAENTLLENSQLVVLFAAFILCLKAKNNKVLFNFGAMVIFLMIMRELSYGRCIFCQLPDDPHNFYPWSHYKYGWMAHIIVGIYIAISLLYAVVNKIWVDIKTVLEKFRFPFWDFVCMAVLVVIQYLGERTLHNSCLEEIAEFTLYCAIFALVYYFYKRTFVLKCDSTKE